MGDWPALPETWDQAATRFARITTEAIELAAGRNVLLITHAEVGFATGRCGRELLRGSKTLLLLRFECIVCPPHSQNPAVHCPSAGDVYCCP